MPWAKIDDGIVDHPKTLIVWSQDPAAFALDVRAIAYCAKHLTDGFLADAVLDSWFPNPADGTSARLTTILVDAVRWERVDGGFEIRDFLDYNRSREEVEAERAKRAKSGGKGGKRSGEARRRKQARREAEASLAEAEAKR